MSRQISCPNCGGEHALVNPGITMVVCNFCKTTVYWGEDQQLKAGRQSILPSSDTRLFQLASGKLQGRGFQVVGHLRYDHGRGSWDEWYLQLDDGGVAWISEDERELSLEAALRPDDPLPPHSELRVGQTLNLGSTAYTVRELGTATCLGGEGQLPFTILPQEKYAYADIASVDGTRFATLEYDDPERPSCFAGDVLAHDALQIDDERPPSAAAAAEGKHIKCTQCAAALEVPLGREVETKVCEYCGAQLDLTDAERRVLGVNPADYPHNFVFEIGQVAKLQGKRYEVCGRMVYQDDESYVSREYLLFSPDAGYLWLAEDNGHYVLNRPTQQAPTRDPLYLSTKQSVQIGPTSFRLYEQGHGNLVYVDGALPWLAKVGDRFRYADLIAPPQIYGVETDGKEVEYFHGRYLPREKLARAFGLKTELDRGAGVHPAQPFTRGPAARMVMWTGLLFALLNGALLVWSLGRGGQQVFHKTFRSQEYLAETISQPFDLPQSNIIALSMAAPLANSWLSVDVAFLNDKDQVVGEADGGIEYYSGVEGGESWSEGNRSNTSYFKAPPAGRYRLILKANGGSGHSGVARGETLTIGLRAGAILSRYFLFALLIALAFPLYQILRQLSFEQRRWAPVTADDDDDD